MNQIGKGTIWFVISFPHEVTKEYIENCRETISQMFDQEIFSLKRGSAILSFNEEGKIGSIETRTMRWRKSKLLSESKNSVKVGAYDSLSTFTSNIERANQ